MAGREEITNQLFFAGSCPGSTMTSLAAQNRRSCLNDRGSKRKNLHYVRKPFLYAMKFPDLFKSFSVSQYYVIVVDLCSSSVILEKLQEQDKLRVWRKFWKGIFNHVSKLSWNGAKCIVYKFVGDGFILLYRPHYARDIMAFCESLKTYINENTNQIIEDHISGFSGRTGITIGIDKGEVIRMRLRGNPEYMGKAINVAARLQSLLKLPEHSNKLLVSMAVKNEIQEQIGDAVCKPVEESLHNLYGNSHITFYEIEMK